MTAHKFDRHPVLFMLAVLFLGWFPYAGAVGVLRGLLVNYPRATAWLLSDFLPVIVAITGLMLVMTKINRQKSLVENIGDLGLAPFAWRHVVVGLIAGAPAVLALVIRLAQPETDSSLGDYFVLTAIRVILAQALYEELLFRGFLFKRLSQRLSFRKAALLAALAFGLCHFGNLLGLQIPTAEKVVQVCIQVVTTGCLAFAPMFLVWRSGGSLWPACIWHLLLDVGILFPKATPDPQSALLVLGGTLLTLPAAIIVAKIAYRNVVIHNENINC